jgi:hypothetical protein
MTLLIILGWRGMAMWLRGGVQPPAQTSATNSRMVALGKRKNGPDGCREFRTPVVRESKRVISTQFPVAPL